MRQDGGISLEISEAELDHLVERSLLGLLMDRSAICALLEKYPIASVANGQTLCREGERASNLVTVIRGNLSLQSPKQALKLGDVTAGRSVNLHSVVRKLPYQYDVVATAGDCAYVSMPWAEVAATFKGNARLEAYLETITGSPEARRISKDVDRAGCSSQFRVNFIGSLKKWELRAQEWIVQQGEIPAFCFFHVEGSIHAFQAKDGNPAVPLWDLPRLAWHLWSESGQRKAAAYSFRTLTPVTCLQAEAGALDQLARLFPLDLKRFGDWLLQDGAGAGVPEDEANEEELESLRQLFTQEHLERPAKSWRFPWVAQYNQMDCGPACMAMVSKYFGNDLPIQYWREQIGTNRDGSSLFDLAQAAERCGFIAHGISVQSVEEIEKELFPFIALRDYHFLVVYALRGKKLVVGNPGSGVVEIGLDEFNERFENAVLLLKPGPEFYAIEVPLKGSSHYFQLARGYGREAILVLLCSLMLVVFGMFPPLLSQLILDEVLSKKDERLLFIVLAGGVLVSASRGLLSWMRSYYLAYITTKFDYRVSSGFMRKLFSLPYSFFATRHVGDFTRRLSELERVRRFFTQTLIGCVVDVFSLIGYAAVLASYSPKVALATFGVAPVLIGISMLFAKRLRKIYASSFVVHTNTDSLLADLIKGVATIKTMAAELAGRWRYEEKLVKSLRADNEFTLVARGMEAATDAYNQAARFLLMGFAAYLGIRGELSPGQVVALSMLVNSVIDPFHGLAHAWSGVQEVRVTLDRLNDIFLAPSEASGRGRKVTKDKLAGEVEFRDVWFRYGGESADWVLQGLSFKIAPGQNVAIVGESGSGKSTIAYLLSRMYEPQKGQILIDGRDVRDYDLQWLRQQVGMLHQESHLFHGTLASNIAFGTPRFDLAQVERAARMSDAQDFVNKKSGGFEYVLSHGGLGLSGGEKQRISLARTVFAGASMLVLDEATSALDGISERKLLESIRSNFQGATILSIAHRYTTVRMSDYAMVIAAGRCLGFGTHAQLAQDNFVYARLFGIHGQKDETRAEGGADERAG